MRNPIIASMALATVLTFSSIAFSQNPNDPHWRPCPQCVSAADKVTQRAKAANLPFNPHDLSGLWGHNQNRLQLSNAVPPMTPLGKQKYDATETEYSASGTPDSHQPHH